LNPSDFVGILIIILRTREPFYLTFGHQHRESIANSWLTPIAEKWNPARQLAEYMSGFATNQELRLVAQ